MDDQASTAMEVESQAEFLRLQAAVGYSILRLDEYHLRVVLAFVDELQREETR